MSKVFVDVGVSLDGYIAGPNRGPDNPLGRLLDHLVPADLELQLQMSIWYPARGAQQSSRPSTG